MAFDPIENGESGLSVRNKLNALGANAAPLIGNENLLFQLVDADLNSTDDQKLEKLFDFTEFVPTRILAMDASGAISNATGGIYSAAGKSGTAVVAAAQSWVGLSSTTKVMYPSVTSAGMAKFSGDLFLSLTTPMGSAATCNIYVLGFIKP